MCYLSNINAFFQSLPCRNCDVLFIGSFTWNDLQQDGVNELKMSIPRKYVIPQKLFDRLYLFGLMYTYQQQTLFIKSAVFYFESICVRKETFNDIITTTCTGKHLPVPISISSNIVSESIFVFKPDPHHLVEFFVKTLNLWLPKARQAKNFIPWYPSNHKN